jgi:hypothetical protein
VYRATLVELAVVAVILDTQRNAIGDAGTDDALAREFHPLVRQRKRSNVMPRARATVSANPPQPPPSSSM